MRIFKPFPIFVMIAFIVMIMISFSCSKSVNNNNQTTNITPPTPIDGFNNSDEVGKDSLKAHWTFDDTQADSISGISPVKAIGASYTNGQIGKALNLATGYLIYPPIPNLNTTDALQSFTVSLWTKLPLNNLNANVFFELAGTDYFDIWGQIEVADDDGFSGDTMVLENHLEQVTGTNTANTDDWFLNPFGGGNPVFHGAGKWSLISLTFDGPSRIFTIYADGNLLATKTTKALAAGENLKLQTPLQTLIGTFAFKEDGFVNSFAASGQPVFLAHGITASIDDIRVFNAALSSVQIKALYDLGGAGR